ncbi:MAG: methylthioribulose 1-phosphate dehydratase [Synechococcales bacterium]|nr:methylthioribulose 1-phosphate dehydratase [Synechococcales bacterium]
MRDLRNNLIDAAHYFHNRGWMWGTAGNLSAKQEDGSFWITASGKSKGELTIHDFIQMYPNGTWEAERPSNQPSAETSIHQTIYQLFPEAQTCYHVHSVEANLVSNFTTADQILLPPLEMLKGFGLWEADPQCYLPLFDNHLEVPKIASEMVDRFSQSPPAIAALLIRNHGVTIWGRSTEEARNRIELIEYIFRYMVLARQI